MGKTDLCLTLADLFHTPIIGADSRQMYADIPVCTAAPTKEQMERVQHYFVRNLQITDYFSAARYEEQASELIHTLFGNYDILLASGGSMMYIDDDLSQLRTFWKILVMSAVFILMIMPENLSTAVLLALVVLLMMYVGQIRKKYLFSLIGAGAAAASVMLAIMVLVPPQKISDLHLPRRFVTWQARVLDFTDRSDSVDALEYVRTIARDKPQETHANIAIASSNIFGKGPGNSVERDFLQEASCDFIYAIIIEELGLVGAFGVLAVYLWMLLKTGGVAVQCGSHRYPRYLAMGIAFLITLQALVNMSVAVGLIPVTGQPLPLISTGGTSILATCVYFGILISISWSGIEDDGNIVGTDK